MGIFSIDEQIIDFDADRIYNMLTESQLKALTERYEFEHLDYKKVLDYFHITDLDTDKKYYAYIPNTFSSWNMSLEKYAEFCKTLIKAFSEKNITIIVGPENVKFRYED